MTEKIAKPFLKWAGGKTQLINEIKKVLPRDLSNQEFTFIEPFVGSGAVLFWMLSEFPNIKKAVINDINFDLMNTYKVIAKQPEQLINCLTTMQNEFHAIEDNIENKKIYYYSKRKTYNLRKSDDIEQAALFIFLNRTCFNGLYRVNKKNEFNVPIGSYKTPTICDTENIYAVSKALSKVEILCGDFEETIKYKDDLSLFYFDPPYKPITQTSSFNSYATKEFNDYEQRRLKDFCDILDKQRQKWILSNSDVKSVDDKNNFFDDLYTKYNILRVYAKRNINANPNKRGSLTELLIANYTNENSYQASIIKK